MKNRTTEDGRKFIEVKQIVDLSLDHQHKDQWFKLTNKFYYGKEQVPVYVTASKPHKDAHWHVTASRRVALTIRMYEDGSLEVVPDSSHYPFTPLE